MSVYKILGSPQTSTFFLEMVWWDEVSKNSKQKAAVFLAEDGYCFYYVEGGVPCAFVQWFSTRKALHLGGNRRISSCSGADTSKKKKNPFILEYTFVLKNK
jgi:hypothetical protein